VVLNVPSSAPTLRILTEVHKGHPMITTTQMDVTVKGVPGTVGPANGMPMIGLGQEPGNQALFDNYNVTMVQVAFRPWSPSSSSPARALSDLPPRLPCWSTRLNWTRPATSPPVAWP
jgi:hypothetical protein